MKLRAASTGAVLLVAAASPAWGQQIATQPGVPTREQLKQGTPPDVAPRSAAHVDEHAAFTQGPCPLRDSTLTVAIQHVVFTAPGGGALPPVIANLLAGIAADGSARPISEVCDLRDEANARLRVARFVATAQIPPQRIENGVLRLEVITGHITSVRVRGDAGPFESLIRARIAKLTTLDPLNAADAEKLLVLANDVPGLSVQLSLSPSTTGKPGELVGELVVSFRRFSVVANVQNYNSTLLGRETAYTRVEAYDLLGMNDETFIAGAATFDFKKQKILQAGESIGLSAAGDRLSFTGTIAWSRPKLTAIDLRTLSLIGGIDYTRPLVRTVSSKLEVSTGFEYVVQRTRVYGAGASVPLNRDRIPALYARLDGSTRRLRFDGTSKWSFGGSLELHQGLPIMGATRASQIVDGYSPSHYVGSAVATIVRGQVDGTFALGPVLELATSLRGQYANKPLLNYDTFSLGNLTIGRGYDPGANTGDRAVAGAHEVRANLGTGHKVSGQLYGFYDWVQLWNLDPQSTERSRFLRSVGAGVRLSAINSLRLDLTYAHPLDPPLLTGTDVKRSSDRVMFSITAQLYPFNARR